MKGIKGWPYLRFFSHVYPKMEIPEPALPPRHLRFNALKLTPFDKVRVVILGQDPYFNKGYANGLAFSVLPHVKSWPAPLREILLEYQKDLGLPRPNTGDLSRWGTNGVLLLNTVLTVTEGEPNSHRNIGWEKLTYEIVRKLSQERQGIVWMLWGKAAEEYRSAIGDNCHCILIARHPSPAGGRRFRGCRHFSLAAKFMGVDAQQFWRLP